MVGEALVVAAEQVISDDTKIDQLRTAAEEQAFGLLALQAPVAGDLRSVIAKRDVQAAAELEAEDDVMDRLHKQMFLELLSDDWPHGIESAIDVTLLGRYYERFADHAVSVARRVTYLVTGERPHTTTPPEA